MRYADIIPILGAFFGHILNMGFVRQFATHSLSPVNSRLCVVYSTQSRVEIHDQKKRPHIWMERETAVFKHYELFGYQQVLRQSRHSCVILTLNRFKPRFIEIFFLQFYMS